MTASKALVVLMRRMVRTPGLTGPAIPPWRMWVWVKEPTGLV
jgi:hypothetical protein